MARRKRRAVQESPGRWPNASLEELWAIHLEAHRLWAGGSWGRIDSVGGCNLHTFAPRLFVRGGLWRIPQPEDPEAIIDAFKRGLYDRKALIERMPQLEHFPSSPMRLPKHTIRIDHDNGKLSINGFCSLSMSKAWVMEVLGPNRDYSWVNDVTIRSGDLTIMSLDLEDIIECREAVSLPYPYSSMASMIGGRGPLSSSGRELGSEEDATPARREPRKKASEGVSRAKASVDGVSIAELAGGLGLDPGKARKILRTANVEKPYSWSGAELERVRGILEKGAKK